MPEADNFDDGRDNVTVDRCLAHRCVGHRHVSPHPYEPECGVCMNEAITNDKACKEHNREAIYCGTCLGNKAREHAAAALASAQERERGLRKVAEAARRHCDAMREIPYDAGTAEDACDDVETALAALAATKEGEPRG